MIFPLVFIAAKLLSSAVTAAVVSAAIVAINHLQVLRALRQQKVKDEDIGELIRENLANGNVRVVGSVFSKRPLGVFPRKLRYREFFEGKLDSQLESLFGSKKRVRIEI